MQCVYGILGREITIYMVIYGVAVFIRSYTVLQCL
jgi:hypothetical protein